MKTQLLGLSNGESLNYFETGHENIDIKPTLLFIHGNLGCLMWWAQTIRNLKILDYDIIAVDLRGFGDSTYNKSCSKLGDWAEDLIEFCSLKNIKECIVIGWSFGGGVAMKMAEMAPELVTKLILTCSVSHQGLTHLTNQVPCKTMQQVKENPRINFIQNILQSANRETFTLIFKELTLTHAEHYSIQKCYDMITGSLKQRCYIESVYALANCDININRVKAKGLVIHGQEDTVVPLEIMKSTGQYFKNFLVWENHAHLIPIECNKEYAEAIIKFVGEKEK